MDFNKTIILDGAMGTELQKFTDGKDFFCPEILNITNPELIESIHSAYIEAGAEIIYTNTFGANSKKLPDGVGVDYVIREAVSIAKRAAKGKALIALDIGPIGALIEPMGELTFDNAVEIYRVIVKSGVNAGVDIIAFETFTDLYELKAAIIAAKEVMELPIFATMSFEKNLRTYVGVSIESMAITLEALGVSALGINCSLSPNELLEHVVELTQVTNLPIIIKANNGLPSADGKFEDNKAMFLDYYSKFQEMGVNIFGGCCGTSPEYIKEISRLRGGKIGKKAAHDYLRVCSDSLSADGRKICIIGERLNPTGKKLLKKALIDENYNYIFHQALEQIEAGAEILDVNCGIADVDEKELLPKLIKHLQRITKVPLQIDSVNPEAVEAACRYYNGKPIINSVNGSKKSMKALLPIAKKYGAAIIALAMNEQLPKSKSERINEIKRIISKAEKIGIPKKDIIADCLTLTIASEQNQAMETLCAVESVRKLGVSATLGVSNVSFGMPNREMFTSVFLTEALTKGLNFPIINPNSFPIMNAVMSHRIINCDDENSLNYIEFCKKNEEKSLTSGHVPHTSLIAPISKPSGSEINAEQSTTEIKTENLRVDKVLSLELEACINKGLKAESAAILETMLIVSSSMEIINRELIPILDRIGESYALNKIFLPQLILAAETAKYLFEKLSEKRETVESYSGKKIILATVKGDVHDIGKNLVKIILENYGYTIIDLGKNVDAETIESAVKRENIRLVGLSALMTTTASYMEIIIKRLKNLDKNIKVMVGGAVVTEDFSKKIGADYYAKDAIAAVKYCAEVFA